MKITIIEPKDEEEDEIIIRCRHLDRRLMKLIYSIKAGEDKITALHNGNYFQVSPEEIYYFEAVDNKVFLYLEKKFMRRGASSMSWRNFFKAQIFPCVKVLYCQSCEGEKFKSGFSWAF